MPTTDLAVSDGLFRAVVTFVSFGLAAWAFYDIVKWRRLKGADPNDPLVKDKKVGYVLGLALGVVACLGAMMYQGWI